MAQYSRGADTFICSDTLSADIVDVYDEIGTSFDIMESWSCIENILLNELPN